MESYHKYLERSWTSMDIYMHSITYPECH